MATKKQSKAARKNVTKARDAAAAKQRPDPSGTARLMTACDLAGSRTRPGIKILWTNGCVAMPGR